MSRVSGQWAARVYRLHLHMPDSLRLFVYQASFSRRHRLLLPTAHCPLKTAHCLLPTENFLLPTAHCPLKTSYCPLKTENFLLPLLRLGRIQRLLDRLFEFLGDHLHLLDGAARLLLLAATAAILVIR